MTRSACNYSHSSYSLDELQTGCALDHNIWCADDETLIGRIPAIDKTTDIILATRVTLGYHLKVGRSKLWWPTVD